MWEVKIQGGPRAALWINGKMDWPFLGLVLKLWAPKHYSPLNILKSCWAWIPGILSHGEEPSRLCKRGYLTGWSCQWQNYANCEKISSGCIRFQKHTMPVLHLMSLIEWVTQSISLCCPLLWIERLLNQLDCTGFDKIGTFVCLWRVDGGTI